MSGPTGYLPHGEEDEPVSGRRLAIELRELHDSNNQLRRERDEAVGLLEYCADDGCSVPSEAIRLFLARLDGAKSGEG